MSSQPAEIDRYAATGADGPLWGPRLTPRWIFPFLAFMAAMTVLSAVLTVQAVTRAAWAEAAMCLGFAALFGHLIGYGVYLRWCPVRRGPAMPETINIDDRGGTAFAYSKWGYYWYVAPITLAVLGLSLFAVLSLGNGVVGLLFAVAVLALCLVVAFTAGLMIVLAPGRLTLTPAGLHHRGLSLVQFSPWSGVCAVDAIESGHERSILVDVEPSGDDRIRHYLPRGLRTVHPLLPSIVVSDTWLLTDPLLVLETLRHYRDNPGDRAELGTKAALDRIRHRRWTRPRPAAETGLHHVDP